MVSPESVGMSSERIARIRPAMERYIGPEKMPGVIGLVARKGEIVCKECVGLMDRESGTPLREDAIFRIYSMTKPITTVALLMLYERGHFILQTPVAEFIPGFADLQVYAGGEGDDIQLEPLRTPVTIRHLLTHTSGLIYPFWSDGPVEGLYRAVEGVMSDKSTLAQLADALCELPLAFQPGTRWRYSLSIDVCARLVEIISGQSFDEYLREHLFEPLGMVDTGFWVPEAEHDRLAPLYVFDPESQAIRRMTEPQGAIYTAPHQAFRGGHGLVSTTEDYYRFCRVLLNKGEWDDVRYLGRKTWELMTRNHLTPDLLPFGDNPNPGYGHGLGMRTMLDPGLAGIPGSFGAFGWSGAADTYFWIDPAEEVVGLWMTQVMANPVGPRLAFRAAAYAAIVD